jgi:hypothetical protein
VVRAIVISNREDPEKKKFFASVEELFLLKQGRFILA